MVVTHLEPISISPKHWGWSRAPLDSSFERSFRQIPHLNAPFVSTGTIIYNTHNICIKIILEKMSRPHRQQPLDTSTTNKRHPLVTTNPAWKRGRKGKEYRMAWPSGKREASKWMARMDKEGDWLQQQQQWTLSLTARDSCVSWNSGQSQFGHLDKHRHRAAGKVIIRRHKETHWRDKEAKINKWVKAKN